ncbi:hypothetical protein ACH40E_19625 [Streptomyces acidicola]|uniref:hypothetical protein n=1 Tax=Streptomyces acidicola TaxID=2596892 RepID=UPI00378C56B1
MSGNGDTHNSVSGGQQQGGVTQAHTVNNLWVDLSKAAPSKPGTWLLVLEVLGLVLAALYWPGGPLRQYVVFGLLCTAALVTAGCSVVTGLPDRGRGAPQPQQAEPMDAAQQQDRAKKKGNRRKRVALVTFPVLSLLFSIAGLLAFQNVADTGEVPIEIRIDGDQPLNGPRSVPLTLTVPAPEEPREKLRLSLTTIDNEPSTGTCVHKSTATVTAVTAGITPHAYEVAADDTVDFDLGGNKGELQFTFTLHTEANCSMRLVKATGTLHN